MSTRARLIAALVIIVVGGWTAHAFAQAKAGVVTTLQGSATAARASLPQPVALKFKDDVFLRDRIVTGDRSIVRMLLGGKALVTVRERSALTITEIPGTSRIDLDNGKIALAVAKERMRPGESVEVRTPNAVAAVRGTTFIAEVVRAEASAAALQRGVTTNFYGIAGDVLIRFASGQSLRLGANNVASALGSNPALFGVMTVDQRQHALAGLSPGMQEVGGADASAKERALGATIATFGQGVLDLGEALPAPPALPSAQLLPGGGKGLPTGGADTGAADGLLPNPGFETGDLTGWTSTGAAGVITSLGSIMPPEGEFMGIIHTGLGAVDDTTSTLKSAGVASGEIFLVKLQYNFLSNEFPTQSTTFNDTFRVKVIDGAGVVTTLATESRNTSFTPNLTVSPEQASAGFFIIFEGNGVTGFKSLSKTVVSTGSGLEGILFEIFDVGDFSVDSAALVDALVVTADPPRYFLRNGATLTRTTAEPLLRLASASDSFDSLLVVCCQASVSLAGPVLEATESTLSVPFSLASVVQGGSLASSSTAPLVSLSGGTYTLGSTVGVFDVAGVATATDLETGLVLGTDMPLRSGGALLEAAGATVDTQSVLKIDTALLEATAPLLNVLARSLLTTSGHAVDLAGRAKVALPNDAVAMVNVNSSLMTVTNGHLVNVAGGSQLSVAGNLVSLSNGSTLSILNGLLLNVTGGSVATIGGSLVSFTGSGNVLNVTNTLAPTALIGGVPVSGPADSIRIAGNALAGLGTSGTVKINGVTLTPTTSLSDLKGSLVAVQGAGTITVGP